MIKGAGVTPGISHSWSGLPVQVHLTCWYTPRPTPTSLPSGKCFRVVQLPLRGRAQEVCSEVYPPECRVASRLAY
eukprot:9028090-Pyramimonas_sp.AAC.2